MAGGSSLHVLHVEYAERRMKYGILFMVNLFYECSNLKDEHVPV